MKNNALFILVLIANCFLSAFSQTLLKKASLKDYSSFIRSYLNVLVICGYGLFFLVLYVNVFLLRVLPLSVVNPIAETLPIVLSFFAGRLFFKEKITAWKIIGMILVLSGILIIII